MVAPFLFSLPLHGRPCFFGLANAARIVANPIGYSIT